MTEEEKAPNNTLSKIDIGTRLSAFINLIRHSFAHNQKSILISSLTAVTTIISSLIVFTYMRAQSASQSLVSPLAGNVNNGSNQTNFILPSNISDINNLGILLLGYGGEGHQGGHLTDAIQLLYLDFENSKISLISIPRDLWITLPNGQSNKINAAFYTDKEFAKEEVSNITGLPIHYYIAIDFVGFMRTVGYELDGIDVEVSQTLEDPWYPITGEELNPCGLTPEEIHEFSQTLSGFELERKFPCRYEHLYFEKGIIHMDGGQAMKYVRSRHGSSEGDVSRGKRQQEVLIAMKNKLFSLSSLNNIPKLYTQFSTHVQSDITLDIAQYLAPLLLNSKDFQYVAINLAPSNVLSASTATTGASILISKEGIDSWNTTHAFIQQSLYPN